MAFGLAEWNVNVLLKCFFLMYEAIYYQSKADLKVKEMHYKLYNNY